VSLAWRNPVLFVITLSTVVCRELSRWLIICYISYWSFLTRLLSAIRLKRDKFQQVSLSVKASLASCYWRWAWTAREATDNKNIYNLRSSCSHYENISLLAEVDANSNRNIKKKLCIWLTNEYVHLIISYLLSRDLTRRLTQMEIKNREVNLK